MTPLADEPDLTLGPMTLRPSTCELVHASGVETVEPQVMRVLLALARQPGRVLSRDGIVEQGWDGRIVSEDAINRVLSRIRGLGVRTSAFELSTIRKVGYRLDAVSSPGATPGPVSRATGRRALFMVLACLVGVALVAAGAALWFSRVNAPPAPDPSSSSPALLISVVATDSADAASARALDRQMRATLSSMRGVSLLEGTNAVSRPADLMLRGVVQTVDGRDVIELTLRDVHAGATVWNARFDGRSMSEPTPEERAVSSAARFLAVRLGDRLSGRSAVRDPADPEVERLVVRAQRAFEASNKARHQRNWPLFEQLVRTAYADSGHALERDPGSAGALMVRYHLESSPQYPRPNETRPQFEARLERSASYLARALAAGPDDPEVLVAAGQDYWRAMRWEDSERLLERAIAIDPNSPDANSWYAYHLNLMGRCAEGLRYARIAAGLAPDDVWRLQATPRLLHCEGRREEASQAYIALLRRDPGNVFVLRELYLMRLGEQNAPALRSLVSFARNDLWHGAAPPEVAAMISRAEASAEALEGRPARLLRLADVDRAAYDGVSAGAGKLGRTQGDAWFVLAVEYAGAGATDRALEALREAVDQGSLYLPWALPYGPTEFPPAVSRTSGYAAIWKSSPGIVNLMQRRALARREAAARRQS